MKNTIQKYLFYLKTAKPKAKKQCFTTYINHQDEIFNVVNKLHIKYKKCRNDSASAFHIHLILHQIHFIRLYPYTANSPNSSSIRSN